jgi:hypothetical protein
MAKVRERVSEEGEQESEPRFVFLISKIFRKLFILGRCMISAQL